MKAILTHVEKVILIWMLVIQHQLRVFVFYQRGFMKLICKLLLRCLVVEVQLLSLYDRLLVKLRTPMLLQVLAHDLWNQRFMTSVGWVVHLLLVKEAACNI